jgi:hypothetical protein
MPRWGDYQRPNLTAEGHCHIGQEYAIRKGRGCGSNLTAPPSRFGGAAVCGWGAPVLEQVSVAHVFPRGEDVDGRDKHGYDGERGSRQRDIIACMIERER